MTGWDVLEGVLAILIAIGVFIWAIYKIIDEILRIRI